MVPHDPARNRSERSVACPGVHGKHLFACAFAHEHGPQQDQPKADDEHHRDPGRPNDCSTKAAIAAEPEIPAT